MSVFTRHLFNVPNTMSLLRIALAPALAVLWLGFDLRVAGLAVGTLIGLTDLFDGLIARRLNQITELGAVLDQLGDLVFESTVFLIAVIIGQMSWGWLIVYLLREFTVTIVRSYVGSRGGTLPSTVLGKAKSSYFQWGYFLFFLGLILQQPGVLPAAWTMVGTTPGQVLVWLAMLSFYTGFACSLISAGTYLKAFARFYGEHAEKSARPNED